MKLFFWMITHEIYIDYLEILIWGWIRKYLYIHANANAILPSLSLLLYFPRMA